ncbi:MAG: hypothetical protein CMJ39_01145 [Phycisphaerae bacterium]|nr:hypothetical protein [Phycisphaerae bacterium]|tara:strand:- start:148 stop:1017 length:870 start_codon:yes stop_codon:yes gene_type:complete
MTKRRRVPILILSGIVWACVTTFVGLFVFTVALTGISPGEIGRNFLDLLTMPNAWILVAINLPIIMLTQYLFLLPLFRFKPELGGRRSLRSSMIVAAFGASLLSIGLLMGLVSLVQLLTGTIDSFGVPFYMGVVGIMIGESRIENYFDLESLVFWIPLIFLIGSWVFWSVILCGFAARRTVPAAIRRVTGLLFAGTMIEVLLVIPLEAMVRRRSECYCETGSFQMLVGSILAGIWLMGPGVLILVLLRRPAYWGRYCPGCGHAKGPKASQPANCPECGQIWIEGQGPAG